MRKIKEYLSIIIMRDAGPRRSFRVHRGRFYAVLVFFLCTPLFVGVIAWHSLQLWRENSQLRENMFRIESELQAARKTAERLENLEELLREDSVQGRDIVVRGFAGTPVVSGAPTAGGAQAAGEAPGVPEGVTGGGAGGTVKDTAANNDPGHEEFAAVITDYLKVENVRVRALLRNSNLRISLDLYNTDKDTSKILSGTVRATLITSEGVRQDLSFTPEDVSGFSIKRFKRAVMIAGLSDRVNPINAQVIIEVITTDKTVAYRNIFSVER